MSKQFLTQQQALEKIGRGGGSSRFCTRSWLTLNGNFDTKNLTNYQYGQYVVDDDIVEKTYDTLNNQWAYIKIENFWMTYEEWTKFNSRILLSPVQYGNHNSGYANIVIYDDYSYSPIADVPTQMNIQCSGVLYQDSSGTNYIGIPTLCPYGGTLDSSNSFCIAFDYKSENQGGLYEYPIYYESHGILGGEYYLQLDYKYQSMLKMHLWYNAQNVTDTISYSGLMTEKTDGSGEMSDRIIISYFDSMKCN